MPVKIVFDHASPNHKLPPPPHKFPTIQPAKRWLRMVVLSVDGGPFFLLLFTYSIYTENTFIIIPVDSVCPAATVSIQYTVRKKL